MRGFIEVVSEAARAVSIMQAARWNLPKPRPFFLTSMTVPTEMVIPVAVSVSQGCSGILDKLELVLTSVGSSHFDVGHFDRLSYWQLLVAWL